MVLNNCLIHSTNKSQNEWSQWAAEGLLTAANIQNWLLHQDAEWGTLKDSNMQECSQVMSCKVFRWVPVCATLPVSPQAASLLPVSAAVQAVQP